MYVLEKTCVYTYTCVHTQDMQFQASSGGLGTYPHREGGTTVFMKVPPTLEKKEAPSRFNHDHKLREGYTILKR